MSRLGAHVPRPITGLALAVLAVACSPGIDSSDRPQDPDAPAATDSALVELPPTPTTASPTESTTVPTIVPPDLTEVPDDLLAWEPQLVGAGPVESLDGPVDLTFDWGSSPCFVPVEMITEDDDPGAVVSMVESENSMVGLESVDAGWRYSREVTGAQSLVPAGPAYGPTVLDTRNEFIPVMMLDDRGRLLEATPVEGAQDFVADNIEQLAITELGRTMLPWVSVWADLGSVDEEPRRDISSEPLGEVEITSWAPGRYADGAIHAFVIRDSAATDGAASGADDGPLTVRLVVEAVIEPSTLRPHQVRLERLLLQDGSGEVVARELSVTAFDWDNAEGCE